MGPNFANSNIAGWGFRKKVFLSFLAVFVAFTLLLYPVLYFFIQQIQKQDLWQKGVRIADILQDAKDEEDMIKKLKDREGLFFFQVTLLDEKGGILYDSHRFLSEKKFKEEDLFSRGEVREALLYGQGEDLRYSPFFAEKMEYFALLFPFQQKEYVLRTAFPYSDVQTLISEFTHSFLLFIIILLLAFAILATIVIHYLTRPIRKIIQAIKGYEENKVFVFEKELKTQDEFGLLAETLFAFSQKIDQQITTVMQEKNEKAAILESLGEGVIAVGKEQKVTYINHMAESFLGINKNDLLAQDFAKINLKECRELLTQALTKGETALTLIKSEKKYIDALAVPRKEGGAILVLQDKTSLHRIVEKGRDFVANASHELKTPITIIRGFAETLYDHPELTKEISQEITRKIVANCHRMHTLVKNLLTLASIDEGLPASRMQACDLVDIVERAKQTIMTVYPDAVISNELEKGEHPIFWGDGDLLFQAVLNLLDNGAKYSKPPAHIRVFFEKGEKEIVLGVEDKGIGIPSEELERIFERFYAVDKSHSRSMGGSGLGLSIVESIVEKHGGYIEVTSEVGKGTTFRLHLPKKTPV